MNSRYLALTAATALMIYGAPTVNAKTKTVSLKVTTLKPGVKTISGKATPGAKIRVSRYAKTYATGKATKKGTFKLKTKMKLKGGWHYKITAAKKGYQSKKVSRYVVTTKTDQQVAALQSQINALQQQLVQFGSNSQSTDLRNQIANLKNELATLQAKAGQSNTKPNKDSHEPDKDKPVIPFDEKPTEYYFDNSSKVYIYPDMEAKGLADILTMGTDSGADPMTVKVYGHLPKPVNNENLPLWYDTNYPSSKFGTMLVEANGKKGYVHMDELTSLAVGDSYYSLTNLPDYLGTGTMKPTEVNFGHPIADGATWNQITTNSTTNSKYGNHLAWYYDAATKTWHNYNQDESNSNKESETDSVDPFSGTPTEYFVDYHFDFYVFPDMQAEGYATKIDNGWNSNSGGHQIKSIKVYDQSWQNDNANSSSWHDASIPSLKYGTLPVEINGQKGFVKIYIVTTLPVNKEFEHFNNLPDKAGSGTAEPQNVNFKFPLADGTIWTQYSLKAKLGITIQWRYNAATKTWQNMDLDHS